MSLEKQKGKEVAKDKFIDWDNYSYKLSYL